MINEFVGKHGATFTYRAMKVESARKKLKIPVIVNPGISQNNLIFFKKTQVLQHLQEDR